MVGCTHCNDTGWVSRVCGNCAGTGQVGRANCEVCDGKGQINRVCRCSEEIGGALHPKSTKTKRRPGQERWRLEGSSDKRLKRNREDDGSAARSQTNARCTMCNDTGLNTRTCGSCGGKGRVKRANCENCK